MIAYVSGQAGRAVFLRGGKFYGIELDNDREALVERFQLPAYLRHSVDVEKFQLNSLEDIRRQLEVEWSIDRALSLSLFAFDAAYSDFSRSRLAIEADRLLEMDECRVGVLNLLSSAEFPEEFDGDSVCRFVDSLSLNFLPEIIRDINSRRALISGCVGGWREFTSGLGYPAQDLARARYRLAKIGVFRDFVTRSFENNSSLLKILMDPILSANKVLLRDITTNWASRYKVSNIPIELRVYSDRPPASSLYVHGPRKVERPHEAFSKADKKIRAIKHSFNHAEFSKADSLVDYLISDQMAGSDKEFVAKSLCNVAMHCKGLGDINRYFDYTKRAVDLVPGDAWALVQLGNAYLSVGKFREALSSFERAEVAGDVRSSLLGRAEALKAVGQQDVALNILERCIESYPMDEVAKHARASLLAHFGELEAALSEYNLLIASPDVNAHYYCGRALVLDDLGEFSRAIKDIDSSVALSPEDMVPICAKADILRRSGRYSAALRTLEVRKVSAEGRLMLGLAAVRVFRDMGDYDSAISKAEILMSHYPNDIASKVSVADVLRRSGKFEDAVNWYKNIESEVGFFRLARYGYASAFAALKRYDEAISYLSVHAATFGDWTSKLLLGFIYIRQGDYNSAEAILQDGRVSCPWVKLRTQFTTALAHLRLRQGRPDEVEDIFRNQHVDDFDEGVSLISFHLHAIRGQSQKVSCEDFVGKLFRDAINCLSNHSSPGFDYGGNGDIFEAEWLALASLAA